MSHTDILVLCQIYNTKESYLRKCIESVLEQTYRNFRFILVDNGSTDGSSDIMLEYSKKDDRVSVIKFEKNCPGIVLKVAQEHNFGEYITLIDSDDWWEQDYLKQLVEFANQNCLDIAYTGCVFHQSSNGIISTRIMRQSLIMDKTQFAEMFVYYHVFFRTSWGKLVRSEIFHQIDVDNFIKMKLSYGTDTLVSFALMRKSSRVGINNSALYNYRIHKGSRSHNYNNSRLFSDIYLYDDAINFLSSYGSISENNLIFLHHVYSNAVNDTLANIIASPLSPSEKLEEYYTILARQVTKDCYKRDYEDITINKTNLFYELFKTFSTIGNIPQKWHPIFPAYFPKLCASISIELIKLVISEKTLLKNLIDDDPSSLTKNFLSLLSQNKHTKHHNLPSILQTLSQNNPLLSPITDPKFLKKYPDIYILLFETKYEAALDAMTDILLQETVNNETFLQLYLSLCALLEYIDGFIFGKIKIAKFFFFGKRYDECKEILNELTEMGVEDNEEISDMKVKLSEQLN